MENVETRFRNIFTHVCVCLLGTDTRGAFKFIGFGAMQDAKPYKIMGFGAMDAAKTCQFIGSGAMCCEAHVPNAGTMGLFVASSGRAGMAAAAALGPGARKRRPAPPAVRTYGCARLS